MTFKEMIFKGLCDGTVKIISNPNDDCIACQIGEFWFYFIGSEDEDLTPDEVYESYTKEQLTEMIYSTLQDMEKNEFDEVEYYKAFLEEEYEANNKNISTNELAELLDARDKLCAFCENDNCEKCQVTMLIDDAYNECPETDE